MYRKIDLFSAFIPTINCDKKLGDIGPLKGSQFIISRIHSPTSDKQLPLHCLTKQAQAKQRFIYTEPQWRSL